ncbi:MULTISPECIES: GntR family transcriptional regulator [unclassified Xanthobacter]|uniref:GntR family transcriptional regulator n=1 Tax=unclassified Xanthobacter TaxID=2623496 RepID=UPI001EDCC00B|nr:MULTISPECIES: GntR family transcriptional regulator [unclassified Xanthobacter]
MRALASQPSLVDQVVEAITAEIVRGDLPSNSRLIQDELARAYGVSRQPVQQALLLLRSRGLVRDAEGRGLIVAPLDVDFIRNLYQIRAVVEGLAASLAARNGSARARAEGARYIEMGLEAVKSGSLDQQIEADIAFHAFLGEISGNPLLNETTAPHWPALRRVMGEVLREDVGMPSNIWDEHSAIMAAVVAGDGEKAERLGREHIQRAADVFVARLKAQQTLQSRASHSRRIRLNPRAVVVD